jgi:hypothetical protein
VSQHHPQTPPPHLQLSRRAFLAGTAGLALAAACGSDDDTSATSTTTGDTEYALGVFFDQNRFVHTGGEQRLPFGLFAGGLPAAFDQAPDQIEVTLANDADTGGGQSIVVPRHGQGMPRPYFPVTTTFDRPGTWSARSEIDGNPIEATFVVNEPDQVSFLKVGEATPEIETPTIDDAHGVNPICTNTPPCPLHDVTLAAALDENSPIAFLVASPAFCVTSVCGPVLDVLLAASEGHDGIHFLHAEVYVDPTVRQREPTPAMTEMGLTHEPVLYLIGADGLLVDRLDFVFDIAEVSAALGRLSA